MADRLATIAIPSPCVVAGLNSTTVVSGPPIPPIERIRLFSSVQWEEFILEWVDSLRPQYMDVRRCGGAGDMGRDVIAMCSNPTGAWENYQCKHYESPLTPTDIWLELGKLAYYTFRGDYTPPKRYRFVAPQGAGTKLSQLFKQPQELRQQFLAVWDEKCRSKITSLGAIELDSALRSHIEGLDFSIFDAVPPLRVLDAHAKTRWHVARFGGGLPPRPPPTSPPAAPTPAEATYVRELLDAYADHLGRELVVPDDLGTATELLEHFGDSRLEFYSAESLRVFSRDTLPPGEFEKLQDEIHVGIRDDIRTDHADGYRRLIAVVRTARLLQLTAHALATQLSVRDRGGICHQLANDNKVKWVKRA